MPMPTVPNHARLRLEQGKLSLGMGLRQARTVDIAEIARLCGFDLSFPIAGAKARTAFLHALELEAAA
jgi:hypothetical protein